jgi:hypothetical protein
MTDLLIRGEDQAATAELANSIVPVLGREHELRVRRIQAHQRGVASEPVTTAIMVAVAGEITRRVIDRLWAVLAERLRRSQEPISVSPGPSSRERDRPAIVVVLTPELAETESVPQALLQALGQPSD